MTHDPLCPTRHNGIWEGDTPCKCEEYTKVRKDERSRLVSIVDDTIGHGDNCNLFMTMDGGCDCGKNDLLDMLMGKP